MKDDVLMTSLVIMKRKSSQSMMQTTYSIQIKSISSSCILLFASFVSNLPNFTFCRLRMFYSHHRPAPWSSACNSSFLFNLPHRIIIFDFISITTPCSSAVWPPSPCWLPPPHQHVRRSPQTQLHLPSNHHHRLNK